MSGPKHFKDYCTKCMGNGRVTVNGRLETCTHCKGVCYEPATIEVHKPDTEDIKP